MRRFILILSVFILVVSLCFAGYQVFDYSTFTKDENEKKEVQSLNNKIKEIDKAIQKKKQEKEKLEKENQEKVKELEVWEKEVKKVKANS